MQQSEKYTLGQFGSVYLNGSASNIDLNGASANKYVGAITCMEDTTFTALENLDGTNLANRSISTVDGEDEIATPWGAETNETSDCAKIITTSHVFPKGITIYGRWDNVTVNSGSCVCYVFPLEKSMTI